jgi:putative methyltransferase (TIGR04325 family)
MINLWEGNYFSWQDAKNSSTGYHDYRILDKVKNSLLKVKNGQAVYERDSVLFKEVQYSWGLLAGLQKAAIEYSGKLCVLDFGGSLGSSYFQNKDFLKGLKSLHWCIIEQSHFVECGKAYFEDEQLKFFYTIDECLEIYSPNVLLLSSVLQYLEKPYYWIDKFLKVEIPFIILDRTAFIDGESDTISIQNVPEDIYKASYPAWFFAKDKLIKQFKEYAILGSFNNGFTPDSSLNGKRIYWEGMILKR